MLASDQMSAKGQHFRTHTAITNPKMTSPNKVLGALDNTPIENEVPKKPLKFSSHKSPKILNKSAAKTSNP